MKMNVWRTEFLTESNELKCAKSKICNTSKDYDPLLFFKNVF